MKDYTIIFLNKLLKVHKIFTFETYRTECREDQLDDFFPKYLLKVYISENQVKIFYSLYKVLTQYIKKDFSIFVSVVVFHKSPSLIEKDISTESYIRIIFEIIFFVNVIARSFTKKNIKIEIDSRNKKIFVEMEKVLNEKELNLLWIKPGIML
ncbi:hypothetical protein CWI37_0056p0060 [Hamiltosporidium tvaerminnensis]|uniref:Uncharacterized protein n=1 Tax=Hamiltosporidium tvaerminnensis TaxID=1176355 RepID=A0A4Q9LCE6_9MICR|nr:hypothetical protein CWI37_0056p0060 [Hamiltosporidium tvaerminnensis]